MCGEGRCILVFIVGDDIMSAIDHLLNVLGWKITKYEITEGRKIYIHLVLEKDDGRLGG
jgi:hypothetical protein